MTGGLTVVRHEADDVSWAFASCPLHPALAADVVGTRGTASTP